jgi:hypothetical protein
MCLPDHRDAFPKNLKGTTFAWFRLSGASDEYLALNAMVRPRKQNLGTYTTNSDVRPAGA